MKKNIALITLGVLLTDALAANYRAKRSIIKIGDLARYMATKLDEAGVEETEFDKIVFRSFAD